MPAQSYFQNFQLIPYGNSTAINITERAAILSSIFSSVYTFYPYQVKNGMRARTVAEKYYGDPNLEWLVYYCNGIIDPYHDWVMDDDTFNSFIVDKYGSVQNAYNTIVTYRINWYEDDTVLSSIQYNSLLPNQKKYWTPTFDDNNYAVTYVRKELDFMAVSVDKNGNVSLSVPASETSYWSSVSAYDYENEENVKKSHIKLIDSRLVNVAVNNLHSLLSE